MLCGDRAPTSADDDIGLPNEHAQHEAVAKNARSPAHRTRFATVVARSYAFDGGLRRRRQVIPASVELGGALRNTVRIGASWGTSSLLPSLAWPVRRVGWLSPWFPVAGAGILATLAVNAGTCLP